MGPPSPPHPRGAPAKPWPPRYSDRLLAKLAAPREPAQRRAGEPREDPLLPEAGAQPPVEADRRRVPVEHRPLHAPAATAHGDPREGPQQRAAGAGAARLGQHEEIFQVEGRLAQERRVGEEVEGQADGAAVAPADQRVEVRAPAEPVAADGGGGDDALALELLVAREAADQLADDGCVARGAAADAQGSLRRGPGRGPAAGRGSAPSARARTRRARGRRPPRASPNPGPPPGRRRPARGSRCPPPPPGE